MMTRILPPEEWPRLECLPFKHLTRSLSLDDASVVVVEDGEKIVATLTVYRATHLENAWVDPQHRNAGIVRALLRHVNSVAADYRSRWAYGGAEDEKGRRMLERIGGQRVPNDVYVLPLGPGGD